MRSMATKKSSAKAIATGNRAVPTKSVASASTRRLSCPRSTMRCSMDGAIRRAMASVRSVNPAQTKTRERKGRLSNCCWNIPLN
jgi:hypothetical protein